MSFNGAGVWVLPAGLPYVTGTVISSAVANSLNSDLATSLTNCVTRDGQSPPTANLPMGSKQLTGLGAATGAGNALVYGGIATVSSVASSGAVSGTSVAASGAVTGATVAATGAVSGASVAATGTVSGALVASSGGMTFGNASQAGLTNLDWYEEVPSYSPTISGSSTAGTTTYTSQNGSYTRIGNRVFAQFEVLYSAATGIGSVTMSLPTPAKLSVSNSVTIGSGYANTATPFAEIVNIQTKSGDGTKATFSYKNGTSIGTLAMSNTAATFTGILSYEAA